MSTPTDPFEIEQEKARRDFVNHLEAAPERLKSTVLPIYREVLRGTPDLIGSAILLRIATCTFLCTAAHVMDWGDSSVLLLPNGKRLEPYWPGSEAIITALPRSQNRIDDRVDLFIERLSDSTAMRFSTYEATRLPLIDQDCMPSSETLCMFLGFPASKNKSRRAFQPVQAKKYSFINFASDEAAYRKHGFSPNYHLVADHNQQLLSTTDGKLIQPVYPHGISGGAVWRLAHFSDEILVADEKLIGMALECRSDALIALHVRIILFSIGRCFPDMREFIPSPQFFPAAVDVDNKYLP